MICARRVAAVVLFAFAGSIVALGAKPTSSGRGVPVNGPPQGRAGGAPSTGSGQAGAIPTIEDRTAGMRKLDGYFPLYWDDRSGLLWLEIPRFDTPFLFTTGLSAGLGSNDIGLDRGSGGGGRLVRFERVGQKVMLVQPNQSFRSRSRSCGARRWPRNRTGACWSMRRRFFCAM